MSGRTGVLYFSVSSLATLNIVDNSCRMRFGGCFCDSTLHRFPPETPLRTARRNFIFHQSSLFPSLLCLFSLVVRQKAKLYLIFRLICLWPREVKANMSRLSGTFIASQSGSISKNILETGPHWTSLADGRLGDNV